MIVSGAEHGVPRARSVVPLGLFVVALLYLHNTLPLLTTLPRINVDEPWLIERAYQLIVSGTPSQPMFLLDTGYLLQPGYSLFLAPWLKLFGVGLLQARVLAVLFGLATLWCVYSCGADLFQAEIGVLAALLLATDSNFLGISRFARTDGPAVLFASLALALFLRARATGRRLPLFGAGIAAGIAMLCHANCYWVVIVLGVWHLLVYGRRFFVPALVAASGFALSFGPYLAVILTRRDAFNAQLNMFAIERVPSLNLSTIASHVIHETERYRDWYFGLITDFSFNPVLILFQLSAAAGLVWVAWRAVAGGIRCERRRSEELLASFAVLVVTIFAAFIPNKALVYLPHLLLALSLTAAYALWRGTSFVAARIRLQPTAAARLVVLLVAIGGTALLMYDRWYYRMSRSELTPYAVTDQALRMLVPPGPKYLIGSPTFWLAFHDDPTTKFVSYTAAGPYRTVQPMGFFTRRRIFDLPQDRPYYVLVDDNEWRAILDDPTYDKEWRDVWVDYIEHSCSLSGVAMATAHGNIALYRCWNAGAAQPLEPIYVQRGRYYHRGAVEWSGTPSALAAWKRYKPGTRVADEGSDVRVAGTGAGIFGDVPVRPRLPYLLEMDVDGARAGDWASVHSVSSTGALHDSRWLPLKSARWFPGGTIVTPPDSTLRLYLYSESTTDFRVRSLTLFTLRDDTPAASR
jgi:4-amino-4-deoxy-L-arabinose transferase-like glycosyltransferase